LFIRSYERGERVHLAMISRGFDGRLPEVDDGHAGTAQWAAAMSLPAAATLICVLAWAVRP
jgi:cobalt/nickel transport system permease protein